MKKTFEIGKITSIFMLLCIARTKGHYQASRYNHWLFIGTRKPWGKFF